jgi:hypothetical protein
MPLLGVLVALKLTTGVPFMPGAKWSAVSDESGIAVRRRVERQEVGNCVVDDSVPRLQAFAGSSTRLSRHWQRPAARTMRHKRHRGCWGSWRQGQSGRGLCKSEADRRRRSSDRLQCTESYRLPLGLIGSRSCHQTVTVEPAARPNKGTGRYPRPISCDIAP